MTSIAVGRGPAEAGVHGSVVRDLVANTMLVRWPGQPDQPVRSFVTAPDGETVEVVVADGSRYDGYTSRGRVVLWRRTLP